MIEEFVIKFQRFCAVIYRFYKYRRCGTLIINTSYYGLY